MADPHKLVMQTSSTDDQPSETESISTYKKQQHEGPDIMAKPPSSLTLASKTKMAKELDTQTSSTDDQPSETERILKYKKQQHEDEIYIDSMTIPYKFYYSPLLHEEDYQTERFNTTQSSGSMMEHRSSRDLRRFKRMKKHQNYRHVLQYKESIKQKYKDENVKSFPPKPSQDPLYTEPVIVQKTENDSFRNVTLEELFKSDMHLYYPETVILQGASGCGKSFLSQKVFFDWASGKHYLNRFNIAFCLKCEELKCISEEINLIKLLSRTCCLPYYQINEMFQNSTQKMLFIIDGLDELTFMHNGFCTSIHQKASPEVIVCSILREQILSGSCLLITSKTEIPQKMLRRRPQRFCKITGFSEKGVEEYFQKFFKNKKELFVKAYERVKRNKNLITACSIPVICWIICKVMKEALSEGADATSGLETITSIYVDFVSTLLEHHCQGLSQSVPTLLRSLGQLAERGMLEQQVLFDEKLVNEIVSDPVGSLFLSKFLSQRIIHVETVFSFMHRSFQEFFTALYCVLLDEEESKNKVGELLYTVEKEWAFSCWSVGSMADVEVRRSELLEPVIEFLCGLCKNEWIPSLFGKHNMAVLVNAATQIKEWISQCSQRYQNEHMLFILHCLYELHEKSFTREVLEGLILIDLSNTPLKMTDCWVLKYCLQCCERIRHLKLCVPSDDLQMLKPELYRCEELCMKVLGNDDYDPGIFVSVRDGDVIFRLTFDPSRFTSPVRELKITRSAFSTMDLEKLKKNLRRSIFQCMEAPVFFPFQTFCHTKEVDHLFAFLQSLSGLKEVHLHLLQLTVRMAQKILSLMQVCPSLNKLRINVETQLMSEKISLLQKSGWTMTVRGKQILIQQDRERFEGKDLIKIGKSSSLCSSDFSLIAHGDNSSSLQSSSEDTDVFTPDCVKGNAEDEHKTTYRFVCAHAGQFQCSLTSLVFVMEGEGEVLYRVTSWDPHLLDGLGQMQPAGPLYNIDCFSGSISRLHLPHCEISAEEKEDSLAVAHFTGGNLEIMEPLQVTETHVVVNIKDFSLFGLLRKIIFPPSPIVAQVVLFLRPITVRSRKKILDLHLLPWNVKLSEVKAQHAEDVHIKTSSRCSLTPGSKYSLCCDPEGCTVQPVIETFENNYGPNYHPTFEVLLDVNIEEIRLSLLHDTSEVWEPRRILLTGQDVESSVNRRLTETEFVRKHRDELIQRVSSAKAITDSLLTKKMITAEQGNEVQAAEPRQQRTRLLLDALDSGGSSVKAEFYRLLKENEFHLVDELESGPSGSQN